MSSVEGQARSRLHLSAGGPLGIDERLIHAVVHGFYGKVRSDAMLKDIFNRVIGDNWDTHLAKMCDFWSSVLLMSGRFHGAPMIAHARIPDIQPEHFAHWLELFDETTTALCPGPRAELFMAKAQLIARSLQYGIAASRGEMPSRTALAGA
jgi:hemoglobin